MNQIVLHAACMECMKTSASVIGGRAAGIAEVETVP